MQRRVRARFIFVEGERRTPRYFLALEIEVELRERCDRKVAAAQRTAKSLFVLICRGELLMQYLRWYSI